MAKISYINGRYLNHNDAYVHMEDRGYQFADGVYEVIAFYNRRFLDEELHLNRLFRSMKEVRIVDPMSETALKLVMRELLSRNDRVDGTLYMQVTRGVAKRDHPFPRSTRPSLTMAVTGPKIPKESDVKNGVKVITVPDQRWARRDIKSIALLPNILAKQCAVEANAREAWQVDADGFVTEGSASNSAIVNAKGEIITYPADEHILGGITRIVVLDLARRAGIKIIERPFSVSEARKAKEAFITGTTANVLPVTQIDEVVIGNGKPGEVTLNLLEMYYKHIYRQTGKQWN